MVRIAAVREWSLGTPAASCRAVPFRLGGPDVAGFLVAHTNCLGCNPWPEMFSFPTDTLKLAALNLDGQTPWRRDLGPAVIPDMNFCPIHVFDHDGDGVDEGYFVDNIDPEHPLATSQFRLARLDLRTGETAGQWPWPRRNAESPMAEAYRNFILGGRARGEPVLVTAQGTYGDMYLQGWRPDMSLRWEVHIPADAPGARGSHMCPILDLDGDGTDELFWGERCLSLDDGRELFCADRDTYRGHSDIIQPFRDLSRGETAWRFYVTREKLNHIPPRVAVYDAAGKRLWGQLETGHIHMGWTARFEPGRQAGLAVRIGGQKQTRAGRFVEVGDSFLYDLDTGAELPKPFDLVRSLPVDTNGDGCHEFVRQADYPGDRLELVDGRGTLLHTWRGRPAALFKVLPEPGGEQILSCGADGRVALLADLDARDSGLASARYREPFYRNATYLTGQGNNLSLPGGV